MKTEIIMEKQRDNQNLVYDSSVDHKGRIPLRSSTGVWKASLFIIVIEFSERLSYFGIATSLVIYLTRVMREDLKTAARNVNYWAGVTTLMPLLGGFLADAYFGRFNTVLASTIVYLLGLSLLTMSTLIPSLKACGSETCEEPRKLHEILFFTAMYLISVGTGGHKPSLESFGADQFDDDDAEERKQKMSFFNWWNSGLCGGVIFGVTLIVYVEEHVGWGIAGVILTSVMALSLAIFILGRPVYRFRAPLGSPLTPLLQVAVAAFRNRCLPYPSHSSQLYELHITDNKFQGRLLSHTNKLKFLDKAAIMEDRGMNWAEKQSPWRLTTVTRVEELKLIVNMIPIWITSLPFGICVAQTSTFFIKQCGTLDRKMSNSFTIPASSMFCLSAAGMILSIAIYDKVLVPILRKRTRCNDVERGITILQRIGIGMMFSLSSMAVAGVVERKRLDAVGSGGRMMSVFWMGPQFVIIGIGDGFALVGLQEYFYEQVPDSMRSLGIAFYLSVNGAGNFVSSLLITVVDGITKRIGDGQSWFGEDLNSSRLDKYYWLIAGIVALNLCVYVFFARRYSYKSVHRTAVADSYHACRKGPDATSVV